MVTARASAYDATKSVHVYWQCPIPIMAMVTAPSARQACVASSVLALGLRISAESSSSAELGLLLPPMGTAAAGNAEWVWYHGSILLY